jgi:ABC-type branched-subunit amino acid transport system ATPase component
VESHDCPVRGFQARFAARTCVMDQGVVVHQASAQELLADNGIKERYCSV